MWKIKIMAIVLLALGVITGVFVRQSEPSLNPEITNNPGLEKYPFRLGLDLSGGTHLVYRADVSDIDETQVEDSMDSLRDVIERRVNLFGVSETNVQTQEASFANEGEDRLIVDLPGVTDIDQAVAMIGQTPLLEFKTVRPEGKEKEDLVAEFESLQARALEGVDVSAEFALLDDPFFVNTDLTGKYLAKASLQFTQGGSHGGSALGGEPVVILDFNKEGGELFEKITSENVDQIVAIYLDGSPISTPVVREAISGGQATISGNFDPDEAKQLVGRLNSGALPIPIELISTQTIGASLGSQAVNAGVKAGIIGFIILAICFVLWYRVPGIIAVVALAIYAAVMFALFKVVPVTLTAAGIAGFIISLGIAVDANVLIFERVKEELKNGRNLSDAVKEGFTRAWLSIRDSNLSSIITAIILFWFGSSLIKGFALTFGIGVLVSMISAITVSRILLLAVAGRANGKVVRTLFTSGFNK